MRVQSKKDLPISLVICGTMGIVLLSIILLSPGDRWMALIPGGLVTIFLLGIFFGTSYELQEERIVIRFGFFVERIPYKNIRSLKLCRNFLSSSALAMDRIEIRQIGKGYIAGTTYISPQNQNVFFEDLKSRCENLEA